MQKTQFPPLKAVVEDMDKIARDLQDVKTILACIAYQQDDKCLQVPFDALKALPKGIELEIGVDRIHNNYVFKVILPQTGDTNERMASGNETGKTGKTSGTTEEDSRQ